MIYNCQLTVLPLEGKHAIKRQLYNRIFACLAHNCTEHTPFGSEPTPQKTIYTNYTWYCRVQRGKHPIHRKTTTYALWSMMTTIWVTRDCKDSIVAQTAHGFSWQWVTVSGLNLVPQDGLSFTDRLLEAPSLVTQNVWVRGPTTKPAGKAVWPSTSSVA